MGEIYLGGAKKKFRKLGTPRFTMSDIGAGVAPEGTGVRAEWESVGGHVKYLYGEDPRADVMLLLQNSSVHSSRLDSLVTDKQTHKVGVHL